GVHCTFYAAKGSLTGETSVSLVSESLQGISLRHTGWGKSTIWFVPVEGGHAGVICGVILSPRPHLFCVDDCSPGVVAITPRPCIRGTRKGPCRFTFLFERGGLMLVLVYVGWHRV
ncbi:unnamed protein product, partial [Ectocarpus sp. 12 AP-2014]